MKDSRRIGWFIWGRGEGRRSHLSHGPQVTRPLAEPIGPDVVLAGALLIAISGSWRSFRCVRSLAIGGAQ